MRIQPWEGRGRGRYSRPRRSVLAGRSELPCLRDGSPGRSVPPVPQQGGEGVPSGARSAKPRGEPPQPSREGGSFWDCFSLGGDALGAA